ncbi:hypothetical protein OG943_39440 [Amycolatopsis sp. NBC_00345]|uniref:hypothetical protein n=1 Tax=Amycolatopsis sp. NBC_00345 TaxID=2975955 RepID=UPI002E2679AB
MDGGVQRRVDHIDETTDQAAHETAEEAAAVLVLLVFRGRLVWLGQPVRLNRGLLNNHRRPDDGGGAAAVVGTVIGAVVGTGWLVGAGRLVGRTATA